MSATVGSRILLALAALATVAPVAPVAHASTCGIFVSTSGVDDDGCGSSPQDPCRTIGNGIARAVSDTAACVFVQAGVYGEVVTLAEGVDVQGGFDLGWKAGPHSDPGHAVRILGGLDAGTGQFLALKATGLTQAVRVSNLILEAPDATGTVSGNGLSSYGVHAVGSNLELENVLIVAGDGAGGDVGTAGLDAVTVAAQAFMNGTMVATAWSSRPPVTTPRRVWAETRASTPARPAARVP